MKTILAVLALGLSSTASAGGNYTPYTVPPLPGAQITVGGTANGVGVGIPAYSNSSLPSMITTPSGTYVVVPNYSTGAVQAVIQVSGSGK
jgi:hypothetical protein